MATRAAAEAAKWSALAEQCGKALEKQQMTREDGVGALWMAVALLADGLPLKAEVTKAATGEETGVAVLKVLLERIRGFAEGQAFSAEQSSTRGEIDEEQQQQMKRNEQDERRRDRLERELQRFHAEVAAHRFSEKDEKFDAVTWLNGAIELLSAELRCGKKPADPFAVPPLPEEPYINEMQLLRIVCSNSGPSFSRWYENEVKARGRSWAELSNLARQRLSQWAEVDDSAVFAELEALASSFDFEKQHLSDAGYPCSPFLAFGAEASKIIVKSPQFASGDVYLWTFRDKIRKTIPSWAMPFFTVPPKATVMETLRAVQDIPSEAWEREKQKREEEKSRLAGAERLHRDMIEQFQGMLKGQQRLQSQARTVAPAADIPPRGQPFATTPSYAAVANPIVAAPAATAFANQARPAYFRDAKMNKSLTRGDAHPVMFTDDPTGRAEYEKAKAAFLKTHPDPATTPLSAAFPLSPGSLALGTRGACDKCGKTTAHIANACTGVPLPEDEQHYRRFWRFVLMRRVAPSWGTADGVALNMIANVDDHMARYREELYGEDESVAGVYGTAEDIEVGKV